jgi:hypothetical protein
MQEENIHNTIVVNELSNPKATSFFAVLLLGQLCDTVHNALSNIVHVDNTNSANACHYNVML